MKNYVIVAIVIILIIIGVVWFKSQAPVTPEGEVEVLTEETTDLEGDMGEVMEGEVVEEEVTTTSEVSE
ncbi:MAG: hypothetical protein WCX70_00395 [Candidatus Paceibacterota bacterium]|jgi:uncharacterized membrane protein YqiK